MLITSQSSVFYISFKYIIELRCFIKSLTKVPVVVDKTKNFDKKGDLNLCLGENNIIFYKYLQKELVLRYLMYYKLF